MTSAPEAWVSAGTALWLGLLAALIALGTVSVCVMVRLLDSLVEQVETPFLDF